jgi:hypothetical protein
MHAESKYQHESTFTAPHTTLTHFHTLSYTVRPPSRKRDPTKKYSHQKATQASRGKEEQAELMGKEEEQGLQQELQQDLQQELQQV